MTTRALCPYLSVLLMLAPAGVRAENPTASAEQAPADYLTAEHYRLDNGLRVVLHVDRNLPVVASNLAYHVGSMHDGELGGLAHLAEHLMFRGSSALEDGEYARRLIDVGASYNAVTYLDYTSYHALLPANQLPLVLWLESVRMLSPAAALTRGHVGEERKTTIDEWHTRIASERFGLSFLAVWEAMYPGGHPFRNHHPEEIERLRIRSVRRFMRTHYGPANACLVLAGDLPDDVYKQVQEQFGQRSGGQPPARPVSSAPSVQARRIVRESELATNPVVMLAWSTAGRYQPGDAEADLLAEVISARSIAAGSFIELSAAHTSLPGTSLFALTAEGTSEADPEDMLRSLSALLDELRAAPPTAAELEQARRAFILADLRSLQDLGMRAERFQLYVSAGKDPNWLAEDHARYLSVSTDSVAVLIRDDLADDRRITLLASPPRHGR